MELLSLLIQLWISKFWQRNYNKKLQSGFFFFFSLSAPTYRKEHGTTACIIQPVELQGFKRAEQKTFIFTLLNICLLVP